MRKLSYTLSKSGKPHMTVFLHGLMGIALDMKHLAEHSSISTLTDTALYDLTNHGASYHCEDLSQSRFSNDLIESLENLGVFEDYQKGEQSY